MCSMELRFAASSGGPENHMPYGLDRLPEASQNHAPYGLCYGFRYRFVCSSSLYRCGDRLDIGIWLRIIGFCDIMDFTGFLDQARRTSPLEREVL